MRRSLRAYRFQVSGALVGYAKGIPRGKNRRTWRHKAVDLRRCGSEVRARQCTACGQIDCAHAGVQCRCDLRVCPTCARRRADRFRDRLDTRVNGRPRHRKHGLYLITFTLRYDPMSEADLSVDGLRARKEKVLDGWRYVWRNYLAPRTREGAEKLGAAAASLEVSPRGAVHVHALYLGRRPDVNLLRAEYMARVGDHPFVDVKYVKKPGKAIRELAKYIAKAASPKRSVWGGAGDYMHPDLAARVEIAFTGARLLQCYGSWRGAEAEDDADPPEPDACDGCGTVGEWQQLTMRMDEWLPIAGSAWRPSFVRAGPPGGARRAQPEA